MRSVKISTLLKVGMLLVLFSFMGCPKSVDGGQNIVNNVPPHNKTLKVTVLQMKHLKKLSG